MLGNALISIFLALQMISGSLIDLCKNGKAEEVLAMLKESSNDVSGMHRTAQNCFAEAFWARNFQVLEVLLTVFPIVPNMLLDNFDIRNDPELVNFLLRNDWAMNASTEQMVSGQDIFRWLLQNGKIPSDDYELFLEVAAGKGYLGVFRALVEEANVPVNYRLCLHTAAKKDQVEIVKYLIDRSGARNDLMIEVFLFGCSRGSPKVVELLCEKYGVNPAFGKNVAIIDAASSGNIAVLQYLMTKGLDPGTEGNSPINRAVCNGHYDMVKFLLSCPKVNPSSHRNFALKQASYGNHMDVIDVLLMDARVYDALNVPTVNMVLGHRCSSITKVTILNWMTIKMENMAWIPVYKKNILVQPQTKAQHQMVQQNATRQLWLANLPSMAKFIKAWAICLEKFAVWISFCPDGYRLADLFDRFLLYLLPEQL